MNAPAIMVVRNDDGALSGVLIKWDVNGFRAVEGIATSEFHGLSDAEKMERVAKVHEEVAARIGASRGCTHDLYHPAPNNYGPLWCRTCKTMKIEAA